MVNFYKIREILSLATIIFILLSCKSEKNVIEEISHTPEQFMKKIFITQTKNGKLKMILKAETATIDENKNNACLKHSKIKFYDKGKYVSMLSAETAVINIDTYDIKCTGICTISDVNEEHLYTTDLIYDAQKKSIYSNNDVKITTPSETIYGTSFESDNKLDKIIIKNPRTILDKN
ncbi:MAG: LPS export ABC transporter periplasmic protein LptC [Endomicrobium sp.]|jgi:LPS export ABC transporter protein LptC|nr:LPS export ABC transporter periplasmic protein LptC [Endomicrobium sp.]